MERKTKAETFVCQRDFDHPLSRLYWAFTSLEAKKGWYGGEGSEEWEVAHHTLDFREGGGKSWRGRRHSAPWMTNDGTYVEILPEQRIIHHYVMTLDGKLFTVSQQVLEFSAKGAGSHLKLTEQIFFIDGVDHLENRIEGTQGMLDTLNTYLNQKA